jgi:acyl-ACP thioesterase
MQTTITHYESTAELIQEEMRRSGKTLEETVNESVRAYLTSKRDRPKVPFKVTPFDMGLYRHLNYDKVWQLIQEVEGPWHR